MPALLASFRIARTPNKSCCELKDQTYRRIRMAGKVFIAINLLLQGIGVHFGPYELYWYARWILLIMPVSYTGLMICALYFIIKAISNANLKKMKPDLKTLALHVFLVI